MNESIDPSIHPSLHPFIPSSLHPFIPSSLHPFIIILYYSSSYTYTFPSHQTPLGGSASHVGQCQPCVQQQRNCWGGGTWRFEDCPGGTVGGCRYSIAMSLFTVPVLYSLWSFFFVALDIFLVVDSCLLLVQAMSPPSKKAPWGGR